MVDRYQAQAVKGLARMLATANIGSFIEGGNVPPGTVRPIVVGDLPAIDGEAIAISPYLDTPGLMAQNNLMVQIRTRSTQNILDGLNVVDDIRDLLHRRTHVQLGDYRFNLISQRSFARLGPDANRRHNFTQNFLLSGARGSRI